MAYRCDLGNGQTVDIENPGMQTAIVLTTSRPGQQQQSHSHFETGRWILAPAAFRTETGVVVRIESEQGQHFVLLQAGSIGVLKSMPDLKNVEVLPLQFVNTEAGPDDNTMPAMEPMEPMKPMEPMRMGNMEMQMNPMKMQMGNLSMEMKSPTSKRFCTQCGSPVAGGDRFCSSCGHRLQ